MPRDVLVTTVGTSLLGQAQRLESDRSLRLAIESKNAQAVALALLALEPFDRTCGAEINSVASLERTGALPERTVLVLLFWDTGDGQDMARYLSLYFQNRRCPVLFQEVVAYKVEGLDDAKPQVFRNAGLRDLVQRIGGIIGRYGAQRVAINATGGYKAQISFAGLIGQALEVPVYYMFERFAGVVEMPPMPVSLDFELWLDNYEMFRFSHRRRDADPTELARDLGRAPVERLEALVERVDDQLVALFAIGELFHQQFLFRFQAARGSLTPGAVVEDRRRHPGQDRRLREDPHLRHVDLNGLFTFLGRVFEDTSYVRGFYGFYTNPDLPKETHFRSGNVAGRDCVALVFSDGTGTAFLEVEMDTSDSEEIKAAVADLNQRFGED